MTCSSNRRPASVTGSRLKNGSSAWRWRPPIAWSRISDGMISFSRICRPAFRGADHHFLINPYGMTFDEITASSLVKVDLDGNKVMDSPYEINPAGFTIHSAIHAAREDAKCVLHVHSVNGAAVSAQKDGLLPISQQSIFVLSSLAYHDYEGVALREDEKPRLVRDLGENNFFMLRNHGLITVADNVPDAFLLMYTFEAACMIQVRAQAGGGELIPIDPRIIATAQQQAATVTQEAAARLRGRRCCASSTGSTLRTETELNHAQ